MSTIRVYLLPNLHTGQYRIERHEDVYLVKVENECLKLFDYPVGGVYPKITSYPLTSVEKWETSN